MLEKDLNWSEGDYGNIVIAFTAAYAIGYRRRVVHRQSGVKFGCAIAVVLWSLAEMATL